MEIIEINENDFKEKVLNSDKKVLVDFYADWCGPCKMMSSVIDSFKEEIENYYIYKVDVDKCPNISREYGIMSIPNLIIFENGNILKQEMGFKSKDELKEFLEV